MSDISLIARPNSSPSGDNASPTLPSDSAREAAQRYQIISELMSDLAYCFRVEPDGNLVLEWVNEAITRIMGYGVAEINELGWQSFLYDADLFVVLEHWQQLIAGEADVAEFRVYGENREIIWVRNYARPVWDEERRVMHIYGAAQNITAKKEAEQHITTLNTQLRLAMKESFHRIKNNLQLVATLIDTQAMDYKGALPADRVEQLGWQIRALASVHNLLTQSVCEGEQAPSVPAKVLIEKLCALLKQIAEDRSLEYQVADITLPHRQGVALALIVNELVQNAFKHGAGTVRVTLTTAEEQAILQVEDAGCGFPAHFGLGQEMQIGLQLVLDLTESDLKGKMRPEKRNEGGASIVIEFPISTEYLPL